ncbi:MAG: zinc-binding dehydrogenase [Acidobacteria bacterium]|nr:zinc-binding dehydrogenase [Acidobacteriota bacterium]
MSTVKAAVLTAYEKPLEMREYPELTAAGPGEAVVRVDIAGICGTDVHLWLGQLPVPLPVVLGHETVGRIEVLGEGLNKDWRGNDLRVGDRVAWASSLVCGECYYCRVKRQPTRCVARKAYGISYCADHEPHLRGGYAEQIHLRAGTAIFRIPEHVSSDAVVGAGCGLATAIHGVERCGVEWGDTVIVQGTGPVGLGAIAVAKQAGATKLLAIGGPPHRLELARHFGADETIDVGAMTSVEERRKLALEFTGGFGADVVIECVGYPDAVNEGIELPRDGGKFLVLGQYANAGNIAFNPHTITRKQLTLQGSWGFEPRHVDRALRMLEIPKWHDLFAGEITARYKLAEANDALDTVRNWRAGKTVLIP